MISPETLAARLAGLEYIGAGPDGSVTRLAWTHEDAACGEWFAAQARPLGHTVARDPAGNRWATPSSPAPWWAVGSHLDSVRRGGRFDGPLGVACAFDIAAACARSRTPTPHIAVLSFADEEGARFNTPTFGSKALGGRLDLPAVLGRRDDAGTSVAEAMRAAGLDPERVAQAAACRRRLRGFVEIHIDQSTEVARAGAPVGVVSGLAARTRVEAELEGRADHAGTTPPDERRDALSAAARLIVAAEELAGSEHDAPRVTSSRIEVEPNATTTIAARARVWIDARAAAGTTIDGWRAALAHAAERLSAKTNVNIHLHVASHSPAQEFDPALRAALADACRAELGSDPPELLSFAGHDAGILAARIPAAMLFVRNRTGVSHAPQEHVDLADAAAAARVVHRALTTHAAPPPP